MGSADSLQPERMPRGRRPGEGHENRKLPTPPSKTVNNTEAGNDKDREGAILPRPESATEGKPTKRKRISVSTDGEKTPDENGQGPAIDGEIPCSHHPSWN